jgi:hypothetical protein
MCASVAEPSEERRTVGEFVDALKAAPGGVLRVGPYIAKYEGEFSYATTEWKEPDVHERTDQDGDAGPGRQEG